MRNHYIKKHVVAKVVLLSVLFFCSSYSVFSSSLKRYQVSGLGGNLTNANGVYIEEGTYGDLDWPYFKHETNNYFLYFEYYSSFVPPLGMPTIGYWAIGSNLGQVLCYLNEIYNPMGFEEPNGLGYILLKNITVVLTATTQEAINISSTSATLNATVRAENATGEVSFEYGTTASYGTEVSATPNQVSGSEDVPVSVTIADLASNTTYYYRVKIESGDEIVYGDNFTFQTEDISSNVETDAIQQIVLYPNPAKDGFYIDAKEQGYVCIYDLSGQLVLKRFVDAVSYIDIQSLAQGVYVVKLHERSRILLKTE